MTELAAKINASSDNPGIRAVVIQDGENSAKLYLSSDLIGDDSAISVSATGGASSLATLDRTGFDGAQNAQVTINGVTVTNTSSNKFDDVIPGLTIEALKETTGVGDVPDSIDVSISRDVDDLVADVSKLVAAFNESRALIREGLDYDPETRTAGALYGDARVQQLDRQFTNLLQSSYGLTDANFSSPSMIGIERDQQGNMVLDEARLRSVLDTNYDEVVAVIAGAPSGTGVADGLADRFKTIADTFGGFGGVLSQQAETFTERLDDVARTRDRIERSLIGYEQLLQSQFASLQALQGQLTGTSQFLDGQFNNSSN